MNCKELPDHPARRLKNFQEIETAVGYGDGVDFYRVWGLDSYFCEAATAQEALDTFYNEHIAKKML